MTNAEGEEVSTLEIKKILSTLIEQEDKRKPLADNALSNLLLEKGYKVARRTVAKYREQLNFPRGPFTKRVIRNKISIQYELGISLVLRLFLFEYFP